MGRDVLWLKSKSFHETCWEIFRVTARLSSFLLKFFVVRLALLSSLLPLLPSFLLPTWLLSFCLSLPPKQHKQPSQLPMVFATENKHQQNTAGEPNINKLAEHLSKVGLKQQRLLSDDTHAYEHFSLPPTRVSLLQSSMQVLPQSPPKALSIVLCLGHVQLRAALSWLLNSMYLGPFCSTLP